MAFEVSGPIDGYPIFLMHGTPGSKTGPKPRHLVLEGIGVRLITYDRPGYGNSDRWKDRSVADAATDVEAIADELDIPKFAVVGRSGGGPHALACAALLAHRVTRTAVLVGIAPASAEDLDWYKGMNTANVEEYTAADTDDRELYSRLRHRAQLAKNDPDSMVQFLEPQLSESDRLVVDDIALRRLLHANYREALRGGPDGWFDDALAFRKPWGFKLSDIWTPVKLWHGSSDTFSPVEHAFWLKKQLINANVSLEIQPDAAHFAAVKALPEILTWLTDAEESPADEEIDYATDTPGARSFEAAGTSHV